MKEVNRYKVISEVIKGYLKVEDAARALNRSQRQVYRIKAAVVKEGAKAVIHKNKVKRGPRWLTDKVKAKIRYLYQTKYQGFNITHMTEFLNEEEKIKTSRESVRHALIEAGLYAKWKKHPKHRSWREPRSREGQMLQFDTSDHDWLEGRGPKLNLIGGIDDATSNCPGARFALSDSCIENMRVLKYIVETKGIPLSFYCDKDSNFKTTRAQGVHYELKGQDYNLTQIARALEELGIEIIYANSAQAKGRVERAWGTFQDRLCSELRLHKISTPHGANHYLLEEFLPKHNRKFAHPAKEQGSAYMPVPKGLNLNNVFCIKEERTVASDNTISYNSKYYQLLPNEYRISFTKARVMVHEWLDGSIHIFYKGKELKNKPIPKVKYKSKETALLTANY
ncbi:MAG: integrase [Candidatus Omnitrophica bacterium CG_4_9_14_0_2_um_filter_42_8]|nr:MAG: integrase [Candidatus Omnitrophica bacterium CG_4_9_14_0_2_um_filter_42_8]